VIRKNTSSVEMVSTSGLPPGYHQRKIVRARPTVGAGVRGTMP